MSGLYRIHVDGRTTSRGGRVPARRRVAEIWEFRHLLRHLVARDLKVKYQRSTLGFLWTFLNPLITVGVLIAVFTNVIRIQLDHYWAFLLSGYFVWNAVAQSIMGGSYVLQEHSRLTRSVAFPKEVLILSSALSRTLEFAVEMVIIVLILAIAHHHALPACFALLPLILLIQVVLTLGVVFPVTILSTLFSDVMHALPVVMTSIFYLTPVFYAASLVPEKFRALYFANPFAGLLTLYHSVLYEGVMPSPLLLGGCIVGSAAILVVGFLIFHRYQDICSELV